MKSFPEVVWMRRKAQGAIEYLFMVAAALIIVALVLKYLRISAKQTGSTISYAQKELNTKLSQQLSEALNS